MSIQTALSRIINAKAAIKAAIEGKGVTVPEATLLDGMAALIDSIEAGSAKVLTGTITWAEITTTIFSTEIEHNFGRVPLMFCIYPNFNVTSSLSKPVAMIFSTTDYSFYFRANRDSSYKPKIYCNLSWTLLNRITDFSRVGVSADESKLYLRLYLDSTLTVTAGDEYRWVITG